MKFQFLFVSVSILGSVDGRIGTNTFPTERKLINACRKEGNGFVKVDTVFNAPPPPPPGWGNDAEEETTDEPTPSPTSELFKMGDTLEIDGQTCILQDDCTCEDIADENQNIADGSRVVPSGTKGDPHFIMFNGNHFDFHGGCDLVLVDAPDFNNGQGLKIHIRTKVKAWFSYVESAVVQIGNDTLEVRGGFTKRRFWHNGHVLPGRRLTKVNGPLPIEVGGFEVTFQTQIDFISWKVAIHLPDDQIVALRTVKDYMRVDIEHPKFEYFASANGLMGTFAEGEMLARDGVSIIEDANAFGMEWQVQDEQLLFHEVDGPQYPQQCEMPALARTTKRLLAESSITYEMAEKACAHLLPEELDDCIYDVIATSDTEIAGAY